MSSVSRFPDASQPALDTTPEEQRALEKFYAYEARLLDNRLYLQWLGLLSEQITYVMPSRVNRQIDNRDRGRESMLSVERELEGADTDGCPLREENFLLLSLRAERAYKVNSWSENPPARTRRLVGNVELLSREGDALFVTSNFHLYYARADSPSVIYSGQRRDTLKHKEESFSIAAREVVLDYAAIELPTVGLLF